MNDLIQSLTAALQRELAEHGALLQLFQRQQEFVLQHDSANYLHLNELVEEQMATLKRCRALRQGLATALAEEHGQDRQTTLPELLSRLPGSRQPQLRALMEEMTQVVERIRQRARQNQLLLARCIETARGMLATMRPAETYSMDGYASAFRPSSLPAAVA